MPINASISKRSLCLPLLVAICLAGNSEIGDVRLAYIPLLAHAFVALKLGGVYVTRSSFAFVLASVFAHAILYVNADLIQPDYDLNYSQWVPASFFLSIFIYYWIAENARVGAESMLSATWLWPSVFLAFSAGVILLGNEGPDGRIQFIFGPNMIYRVVLILWVAAALSLAKHEKKSFSVLFFLSIVTCALVLLKTGSRGAIFAVIPAAITVLIFFRGFGSYKRTLFLCGLLTATIFVYFSDEIFSDGFRLLNYDIDGASIGLRLSFLKFVAEDFWSLIFSFGRDYVSFRMYLEDGYKYPHNIFAELIFFYGAVGAFIGLLLTVNFLIALRSIFLPSSIANIKFISLIYVVYFMGAQFSGDLGDNYPVVAIAMAGVWASARSKFHGTSND